MLYVFFVQHITISGISKDYCKNCHLKSHDTI